MPLPFNPMSFVTPYTAVGTSRIGAGQGFANVINQARNAKVQEGYLQNTQRRTDIDEQHYGQQEMDKARQQLDAAMLSGNTDMANAALNNLKAIGERYGFTIAETRSDAALDTGVTDKVGEQKALTPGSAGKLRPDEVGSEEKPLDVDAYDAAQVTDGSSDKVNSEADARIDAELAQEPSPFTGGVRTPGGSLPAQAALVAAVTSAESSPLRTPGGSLPTPVTAGAREAPLRGYTLIGKDGKPLYTVAPKDVESRQRARVGEVFAGLASKSTDPKEKQWIAEAQAAATNAVGTMPLDEAVQLGLKLFMQRVQGAQSLAITEANHKPRWGGGGGAPAGGYATGKEGQARRAMTDDAWTAIQNTMGNFDIKGLNKTDNGLVNAQAGLNSTNPASQRGAIRNILKAMSGLTVNAKEEAGYAQLAGLAEQARNMLAQLTGDEMSPEYIAAVKQMLSEWRAESAKLRGEAGRRAADAYMGLSPQAPEEVVQEQADTIYRYFVGGSVGGSKPKYQTPEERGTKKKTPDEEAADL